MADRWGKNGFVFICDGRGYCVTPLGGTVCIGQVDAEGNVLDDVTTALTNDEQRILPVTAPPPDILVKDNGVTDEKPDVVTTKIRELAASGKSCRKIERELVAEGINLSYRTVARRLQGVLFDV